MRPHPKYSETNAESPRGWATCERCGSIWNLFRLEWQFEWRGLSLYNTRHLVCPRCLDEPQRQLGANIIPPDPLPLINARPEQYDMDEEPVSVHVNTSGAYKIQAGVNFPYDTLAICSVAGTLNNSG